MVNVDRCLKEQLNLYDNLKSRALVDARDGFFDRSLSAIRACSTIASNINSIYTDDNLEDVLGKIGRCIIGDGGIQLNSSQNNRVVFYDGFGYTNVPLSLQYVRALIAHNYEFLYIFEEIKNQPDEELYNELANYPKATIFNLDCSLTASQKIVEGYKVISHYNPKSALLHLGEIHVEAVAIFSLFPNVVKYRINLGDHQFWLGTKQLDYCLEFRSYGATISAEKRMIPASKLLYQPYYPFVDERPFEGLPFQKKDGDIIMFSGGRLYKVFGRDNEFFSIVKRLLDENPTLIFILAGKNGGDITYIDRFISKNGFKNRFYYLGHRREINEVIKQCDIFLNTYPQSGGLMCMYAALNKKPILTYTTDDLPENNTENLLYNYKSIHRITYTDKDDFFKSATKLIDSSILRNQIGEQLPEFVVTKSKFSNILNDNLVKPIVFRFDTVKIDYVALVKLNLEMENDFYNITAYALIKCYHWKVFFQFPSYSYKIIRFALSWLKSR